MTNVAQFEFILFLVGFIIGLELIGRWLRLPSAVALVLGGLATAVVPGIPAFEIDPDLVLVVFLPPLLLSGAYFSVWREFRANLAGILQLAIGGVLFTALAVGIVMHLLFACHSLGGLFRAGRDCGAARCRCGEGGAEKCLAARANYDAA